MLRPGTMESLKKCISPFYSGNIPFQNEPQIAKKHQIILFHISESLPFTKGKSFSVSNIIPFKACKICLNINSTLNAK